MKVFYAFLIIFTSVVLFMLPIASMVYDFRTDQREDVFVVTTAVAVTTANVTLLRAVFDNDTGTITFTSNTTETPAVSTYNTTTRQLLVSGLEASTTRELDVTYDIDVLSQEGTALNGLMDRVPAIYLLLIIAFPVAAMAAIFLNKA